jgi:hypothetical protein
MYVMHIVNSFLLMAAGRNVARVQDEPPWQGDGRSGQEQLAVRRYPIQFPIGNSRFQERSAAAFDEAYEEVRTVERLLVQALND